MSKIPCEMLFLLDQADESTEKHGLGADWKIVQVIEKPWETIEFT